LLKVSISKLIPYSISQEEPELAEIPLFPGEGFRGTALNQVPM
jgi:hypothetical protein